MTSTRSLPTRISRFNHSLLFAAFLSLAVQSCGSLELATVADTQFILTTRTLPLTCILVACDTRDLNFKSAMETDLALYLREHASVIVFRDIDLFSPLKSMTDKEKLWALKDAGIQGVLFLNGGGSGRSLRDWLYPDAMDLDTKTQAWVATCGRLFIPESGSVIWAAGLPEQEQRVTHDHLTRSFHAAIVGDLLLRGFIAVPVEEQPMIRGFNR